MLDAGDTTLNGTSVEQYCVTTFARAIPDGVELVTSPGNHDSRRDHGQLREGRRHRAGRVGDRGRRDAHPRRPGPERDAGRRGRHRAGRQGVRERRGRAPLRRRRATTPTASTCCSSTRRPSASPPWPAGACPRRSRATCTSGTGPSGWTSACATSARARRARRSVSRPSGPLNGVAEMTVLRWDPATPPVRRLPAGPGPARHHRERQRPPALARDAGGADADRAGRNPVARLSAA